MVILITGCSGFIGYHLAKEILKKNKKNKVIGIDNMNSYYDVELKKARKKKLQSLKNKKNFIFIKADIQNEKIINKIFSKYKFDLVYHLAAQAGVRFSISSPKQYIDSNILGFYNLLECVRKYKTKKFFFASSSSVYGSRKNNLFFKEEFDTDKPSSFYAATKKANEIMAYSYSSLYKINIIGLRFFTAYGPFGRPDMAYYKFTKKIINNEKIQLYNRGNHLRDFTYIDDVINSIILLEKNSNKIKSKFEIFNIGASKPTSLIKFLKIIEKKLGKKAKIQNVPLQKGDVIKTKASINKLKKITGYQPKIKIEDGLEKFIRWYTEFNK
ncbi:MAG: hypothetical protein CL824_03480 [Crocinitomicaceae bacterium]|nr:hypothetical protein [Crocinitomicaceae bacterium]